MTRWMIPAPLTGSISDNCFSVRSEVRRRRWLLPPLVRTSMPDPVRRKRLLVALWVFILYLPSFVDLRGTAILLKNKMQSSFTTCGKSNNPSQAQPPIIQQNSLLVNGDYSVIRRLLVTRWFLQIRIWALVSWFGWGLKTLSSFDPAWWEQQPCSSPGLPAWAGLQLR